MATQNQVNVNINVTDNGSTNKLNSAAERLRETYEGVSKAASRVGGTAGSRAVSAGAAPVRAQVQQYGSQRGVAEATGASARDFANQAQGLSGVVRLYATAAANVYALGAAFRALSGAMDTANMVKGLDQIGAYAGRNLGTLAQRLVQATDGAISLRDALKATAQGTGAGISSANMERMAKVAKNASQALGVDMTDAMQRLSRGVSKLEPELLDELGIMVKIDTASANYARTLGKSAGQLTDVEKRQAFLNEVLAQGEEKFGKLALSANPFTQLGAAIQNVSQIGLEFVAKILTPIVNFLSSSPMALAGVMAGIAAVIIRQAIPAITAWRSNMREALEETKKQAQISRDAFAEIQSAKLARSPGVSRAKSAFDKQLADLENFEGVSKNLTRKISQNLSNIKIDPTKLGESLGTMLKDIDSREQAISRARRKASNEALIAYDLESQALRRKRDELMKLAAAQQLVEKRQQAVQNVSGSGAVPGVLTTESRQRREMTRLDRKSKSMDLLTTTLETAESAGYRKSMEDLRKNVKSLAADPSFGKIRAGFVGIRIAAVTTMAAMSTAISSLFPYIALALAAVEAFSFLDDWASSGKKELEKFSESMDSVTAATENASKTLEVLQKKTGVDLANIDSVIAVANAFTDLTDAAKSAADSAIKAKAALGIWSGFKDMVKSLWGNDVDTKLAEGLGKGLSNALKLLEASGRADEFKETLNTILGGNIQVFDQETLSAAISGASDEVKTKLITAWESFNQKINTSSANLQAFRTGLDGMSKTYQEFIVSTASTDPLFKLGASLNSFGADINKLLTGPIQDLTAGLTEMIKDPQKLAALGPEIAAGFVGLGKEIQPVLDDIKTFDDSIRSLKEEISKTMRGRKLENLGRFDKERVADLEANLTEAYKRRAEISTEALNKSKEVFTGAINTATIKGAQLIDQALGNATRMANLTVQKAKNQWMTGPGAVTAEADIQREEIQIRRDGINSNITLIMSQEKLAASISAQTSATNANTLATQAQSDPSKKAAAEAAAPMAAAAAMVAKALENFDPNKSKTLGVDEKEETSVKLKLQLNTQDFDLALKMANQSLGAIFTKIAAQRASLIKVNAEAIAVKTTETYKKPIAEAEQSAQQYERELKALTTTQQKMAALESILGLSSGILSNSIKTTIEEKQQAANKAQIIVLDKKLGDERLKLLGQEETNYKQIIEQYGAGSEQAIQAYNKLIEKVKTLGIAEKEKEALKTQLIEREGVLRQQAEETEVRAQERRAQGLSLELEKITKRYELLKAEQSLQNDRETAALDFFAAEQSAYSTLYGQTAGINNLLQYRLELRKADTQYQQTASQIEIARAEKVAALEAKKSFAKTDTTIEEGRRAGVIAELDAQIERENTLAAIAKSSAAVRLEYATKTAELTKKVADEQERYNKMLSDSEQLASSLGKAFEGIGDSVSQFATGLGEGIKALTQFAVESEKSKASIQGINDKIAKSRLENGDADEDSDKTKQLVQERDKLVQKSQQREIAGYAQVAGAAKGMFKQKTGAYKAFAAFEKAMHILSIAMKVKEMFFDTTATTAKVANDGVKQTSDTAAAGVSGVRAVIDVMTGLPLPLAIAAGAAMTAVVAGLLSSIGGSGPSVSMPGAPSAEQKNETYGTAQKYGADNQLQQYRSGVLGDASARSMMVTESLELIGANSIEALAYSFKMVNALLAIKKGINNLAGVFKSVQGISAGNMLGVQEGVVGGGNFLSSRVVETDIQSSGIRVSGSLYDLRDNIQQSARVFVEGVTNTSRKVLGGLLGSSNRSSPFNIEETLVGALGQQNAERVGAAISRTLGAGIDLAFVVGGRLGWSPERINDLITNRVIDPLVEGTLNLRDVPISEQAGVIEAWTTGIIDTVFGPMVSGFAKFATEDAEDLTQIAIRVINQFDQIDAAIKQLPGDIGVEQLLKDQGLSTEAIIMQGAEFTQGLAQSFGGYEELMQGMQDFNDSVLTDEEKRANRKTMIQTALKNAGLEEITTLEQLKAARIKATRDANNMSLSEADLAAAREDFRVLTLVGPALAELGDEGADLIKKLQDAFKLTKDATKSIFLDILKNAKDMADAQTKAQEQAAQLIYDSIIENATDAISTQLFDAVIQPMMNNIVTASATAAASTTAGGVIAGTSLAAGGQIAAGAIAEAVGKATTYMQAMGAILRDPTFQAGMRDVVSTMGDFGGTLYSTFQNVPGYGQNAAGASGSTFDLTKFLENIQKEIASAEKQLRQLTMTSYERSLEDITEKVAAFSKELEAAAVPSAAATLAIESFKEAQIALLEAQNKAKATDIMNNLRQQMSDALLSPIGKELVANSRQAFDYVKQLRDINQLTEENIKLVNEFENANRQRILDAALAQQNTAYDALFQTNLSTANSVQKLVNKFKALGYELPKSTEELQGLVDGINYTSEAGLDLRGKVLELGKEFASTFSTLSDAVRSAYDKRVEELTSARDEFKEFAVSIRDFKKSLLLSAESPISPLEKYALAQQEFVRVSQLAQTGDKVAMSQLESVSRTFLEQSRGMFAGTENYVRDFNAVLGVLDSAESVAEIQMHTAMDTLTGVRDTVSAIIRVEEATTAVNASITGLGASLEQAVASYSLFTGFSNLPELQVGTNYVPSNMVAKIHAGERVIPAADNAKLMAKLEEEALLVGEVQQMNRQLKELTAIVAQGANFNTEATKENTEEIVNAFSDLQKSLIYVQKVNQKAMIV